MKVVERKVLWRPQDSRKEQRKGQNFAMSEDYNPSISDLTVPFLEENLLEEIRSSRTPWDRFIR